jgi:predicted nucleic acid-binding protein
MGFLVDTDWAVDYLKGVDEKVRFLQKHEDLYLSTLTVGQLIEGIEGSDRKEKRMEGLENFLSGIKVLAFNRTAAAEFGRIRNRLIDEGKLIGDIDTMIAATAKVNDLEIITDNQKHFKRIEDLELR